MIDAKAGHAPGRARKVSEYAQRIAAQLSIGGEHLDVITLPALWNDIGAFGVPSGILVKPDLLSVDEMHRMRGHQLFSREIVQQIPALRHAAPWVAAHHERIDGKGYPEALSGTDIPTEAGILSICDAYLAMVSPRPYRAALSHTDALAVIDAGAGTQWDPLLVHVLIDVVTAEDSQAAGRVS